MDGSSHALMPKKSSGFWSGFGMMTTACAKVLGRSWVEFGVSMEMSEGRLKSWMLMMAAGSLGLGK